MQRKRQASAAFAIIAALIGGTLGRSHLIGPNPGTFFVLGVLATLSAAGIVYGVWDARRIVRLGKRIGS